MTEAAPGLPEPEDVVACSVLVPVFNEERYLEHSVAAMRRQRFSGQVELVFADGGSTDRTREILESLARQDPRIRVFDNPNRSVSSGLNVALRHARGQWIARMDAHTEYPDDYLALGVERLQNNGTRWVSGPQAPRGDGPVSRAVALALGSFLGRGRSRKWGREGSADGSEYELDAGVFAGVWARSTLLEYGGWDERWPRNSDSEMAGRFLARGERLICIPRMAAEYVPRDSLRGLWRQYSGYGEYRFKTAVRHPHTLRRSHLLAPAIVLDAALTVCGPRQARRPAGAGLCVYAGVLVATALRALPQAKRSEDAALVPLVLGIMHFGHGVGALRSTLRHGAPLAALASAAGLDGFATSLARDSEPVFAPSLSGAFGAPERLGS
ncbi:MAG: glycosyltransferase [Solirubrobacteraceae bacterium]